MAVYWLVVVHWLWVDGLLTSGCWTQAMCMAVYWPQSHYTGHVHGGLLTAAALHWLCAWWSTDHSPLTLAMCMVVYWPVVVEHWPTDQSPYTGCVHGGVLTGCCTLAVCMAANWPQSPYSGHVHGGLLTTVPLHWPCEWWSTDHSPLTLAVRMVVYWPVASPYTGCVYGGHLILAVYMVYWPVVTLAVSIEVYWLVAPLH